MLLEAEIASPRRLSKPRIVILNETKDCTRTGCFHILVSVGVSILAHFSRSDPSPAFEITHNRLVPAAIGPAAFYFVTTLLKFLARFNWEAAF